MPIPSISSSTFPTHSAVSLYLFNLYFPKSEKLSTIFSWPRNKYLDVGMRIIPSIELWLNRGYVTER